MNKSLEKFKNSAFRKFLRRYEKYVPIIFFIGGFIFDSLTLGRIDRIYDLSILCLHMISLTIVIYLYNMVGSGKFKNTIVERYAEYFPLAIQFFFGALTSAFVIYFSRSVSVSKTVSFFVILVLLFITNEFLKKRISNKYLQFSVYFFISFTFFTFLIPVFIKEMNTQIFIISGLVSLVSTLMLVTIIYLKSRKTQQEIHLGKQIGMILVMYMIINVFYFFSLIPPVPLALENGIVAHNVQLEDNKYVVTYETDDWWVFWRRHRIKYIHKPGENVYIYSSIFAPTDLKKTIFHRWKWYNKSTNDWEVTDNIGYRITGGRDDGFRGYTYKNKIKEGIWKVEVITKEELVIGVIDFKIIVDSTLSPKRVVVKRF